MKVRYTREYLNAKSEQPEFRNYRYIYHSETAPIPINPLMAFWFIGGELIWKGEHDESPPRV